MVYYRGINDKNVWFFDIFARQRSLPVASELFPFPNSSEKRCFGSGATNGELDSNWRSYLHTRFRRKGRRKPILPYLWFGTGNPCAGQRRGSAPSVRTVRPLMLLTEGNFGLTLATGSGWEKGGRDEVTSHLLEHQGRVALRGAEKGDRAVLGRAKTPRVVDGREFRPHALNRLWSNCN